MTIFQSTILILRDVFVLSEFICYHGESAGIRNVPKSCPSRICRFFNSACGVYTSTTSYVCRFKKVL